MLHESLGTLPRRSERVLLRIPIRVEGKDIVGNAFKEFTYTQVVNRSGGLIVVSHPLEPGAVIKITNIKSKVPCSFQVVTRATRSLSGIPEWGVKSLEPAVDIWGIRFPTRAEEPPRAQLVYVLLECPACSSREMAPLTAQQYRTLAADSSLPRPCPKCSATEDWQCAVLEAEVEEVLPGAPDASASGLTPGGGVEKRRHKRMAVKLPLGVKLPDGREEAGTTENVSKSGLCFACNLEMQVGDRVYVSVGVNDPTEQRDIPARVMWRRPAQEGRALYGVKLEGGE